MKNKVLVIGGIGAAALAALYFYKKNSSIESLAPATPDVATQVTPTVAVDVSKNVIAASSANTGIVPPAVKDNVTKPAKTVSPIVPAEKVSAKKKVLDLLQDSQKKRALLQLKSLNGPWNFQ